MDWVLRLGGKCEWVAATHTTAANRGNGDMETACAVLLQMENGVIGTVECDFLRPTGSARHDDDRLRVTGTRGMLEAIDGRVYLENENPRRELALPAGENPFTRFVNAHRHAARGRAGAGGVRGYARVPAGKTRRGRGNDRARVTRWLADALGA